MTTRVLSAVLLCALLPLAARAEMDCGRMLRTVVRFDGTVRKIEPIRDRGAKVLPVGSEKPRYFVSVDVSAVENAIEREEGEADALFMHTGETCQFGVHSPSRNFGANSLGKTRHLEAEWMECNGAFRRILSVRTRPARRVIEDTDSYLEVGHTYRAEAQWENDHLWITSHLWIPHHHDMGFHWVDDVPERLRDGKVHPVVFETLAVRIEHIGEWHWLTMYDVRLVEE